MRFRGRDDVPGAGLGFVSVFDTSGNFIKRFTSTGTLNSPWGMVLAPAGFGQFSGALLIGNPDEVVEKIIRHSEALGGISRITFQMNAASLPHAKLMQAIEALGTRVAPALREELAVASGDR